jgi:alpha-beta hydrolase superfamily lysophospholipase
MVLSKGTVIFSHGKESGPWGTKITALAAVASGLGYGVESVDYTDLADPDRRVSRLREVAAQYSRERLVLVGSSMGGYVATVASETVRPAGLFLMAPAFFLPGYACQAPRPCAGSTVIVHGWHDDIVPPEHSIRFAKEHRSELHLLRGDHPLTANLAVIEGLFGSFLGEVDSLQGQG